MRYHYFLGVKWSQVQILSARPKKVSDLGVYILRRSHKCSATPKLSQDCHKNRMGITARMCEVLSLRSWRPEPLPPDAEQRVGEFADLVATAIAAATNRAALIASRRRIVTAADETRRRLERNLHDGAQQRAVSLGLQLHNAENLVPAELGTLKEQLSLIASGLTELCEELREISHGMHPAIVSTGGLGPALKSLARHSTIPVTLDVAVQRRLPEVVEVAAYYVVAEALTNAAKHAQASQLAVMANADDENLHLLVRDDGIGGADFDKGSGLIGLKDRGSTQRPAHTIEHRRERYVTNCDHSAAQSVILRCRKRRVGGKRFETVPAGQHHARAVAKQANSANVRLGSSDRRFKSCQPDQKLVPELHICSSRRRQKSAVKAKASEFRVEQAHRANVGRMPACR
jgi:signal transduction histidine kinase